jgi:hypothetical protein
MAYRKGNPIHVEVAKILEPPGKQLEPENHWHGSATGQLIALRLRIADLEEQLRNKDADLMLAILEISELRRVPC